MRFLTIFDKIPEFLNNYKGEGLKAIGLIFFILALHLRIKAKFAKLI